MKELMDELSVSRALMRMSHQIVEYNKGCDNLVIVGIETGGKYLGKIIQENIYKIENTEVPFYSMNIGAYRDDEKRSDIHVDSMDIKDKVVILVDDVLFTGRTIRAALDALIDQGRPKEVKLAVLIDRGHRQLPIRADIVGKNVPTSLEENVIVYLPQIDNQCGVYIE